MKCRGIAFYKQCAVKKFLPVCLLLVLFCLSGLLIGQDGKPGRICFDHIGVDDGLSQNTILCILQDKKGFMWFGTQHGLNRYDGRDFKVYNDSNVDIELHDGSENKKGKFGNNINDIWEDEQGNIWLGTNKGLFKFNPIDETFHAFNDLFYVMEVNSICKSCKDYLWVGAGKDLGKIDLKGEKYTRILKIDVVYKIKTICGGDGNELWVGTERGLFRVDESGKLSESYDLAGEKDRSISTIYKDKEKIIWVGTKDGYLFKKGKEKEVFDLKDEFDVDVRAICDVNEDNLWIGLYGGKGIFIVPKKGGKSFPVRSDFYHPKKLNDNYVQAILKDKVGTLWVGTFSGGINKHNQKKEKFTSYFANPCDKKSLSDKSIFSIFGDHKGAIWVGTRSGELDKFNPVTGEFKSVKDVAFKNKALLSICEDREKNIWIGTEGGGFYRCLNRVNGKYKEIPNNVLGNTRVRIIKLDRKNHFLWIGTDDRGILRFNPETEEFDENFSFLKTDGLSDNNIYSIFQDEKDENIIWIGTSEGLDQLDKRSRAIRNMKNKGGIKVKVYSIVTDPNDKDNKIIWLGTKRGLCKFDKINDESIKIFNKAKDGLPDDVVYGILKDNEGYLWLSTNNGISQFDPRRKKNEDGEYVEGEVERNFNVEDGLQAKEFNSGAYCETQAEDGTVTMYFGGLQGLSVIQPARIRIDTSVPDIYFTGLKLGGEKEFKTVVKRSGGARESITKAKAGEVIVDYQKQPIDIKFAALDYNAPKRIKYKYKLINKDGKKETGSEKPSLDNSCTLSGLNTGRYTFRAWSSNSDGHFETVENKPKKAEIEILVTKHWWAKWRPILLSIIIPLLLIVTFYNVFKTRTKKRIEKLQMIQAAIDDLSRREEMAAIVFRILDYVVYSLRFDYGAISLINFRKSTISTVGGKSRKSQLVDPNKWKEESQYELHEVDILTEVVKKRKVIDIVGPKINIEKDKLLNKKIFKEHHHKDLIRVFVPIEFRARGRDIRKDESRLVLGVVEAGFHKSTRTTIKNEMKLILKLFISYCAPIFYRAMKKGEKKTVEDLLKEASRIEHHQRFLEMVLEDAVKLIGGDKADISFFSFNEKRINTNDNPIFYNIDSQEDRELIKERSQSDKREGIVRHAAGTKKYYFSGNVKADPYYIEEFEDVNSELAVPIRYSERVIGVINIYSTEMGFFDDRKAGIIQDIADVAGRIYQRKKINQTIKNLVLPFQLFTGIEKIYDLIIKNIGDYFITEFVSVWEKTEEKEIKYKLINACDRLKKRYEECGLRYLIEDILESNTREIQLINFEEPNRPDCGFTEFAKVNDLKAMILVPIIVAQQVYGFINIFSKRGLPSLFPEDKTFLNLIASKGAISAQYEKLISSFMEISESLTSENLDMILRDIAENASKVLHAELVILFRYNPEEGIFDSTIYGSLFHPKLREVIDEDNKGPDHIAFHIIKNGSTWFENAAVYRKHIKKGKVRNRGLHFNEDFWTREKIKSSVGIRLEHNKKPIGVMFFNYLTEQRFDEDTKRFIEAFSALASSAIVNAKYLDLIEKQKETLEKQTEQLEKQKDQLLTQKEKLEFEYEDVYRKMTEMLPRATRTSFYLILEGINHDIRNFFIRMKQAMMDIRENSDKLHRKVRESIKVRVKDIERNIRNVTNLLKLFNFRGAGKEWLKINVLVKELIFFFKTRESEEINFNIENLNDEVPRIKCNKAEMSMIIYNLLSNSVYAIAEKEHPKGEIKITTDFKNDEYIIVVEDNGTGIDKDDIPHIYEAGFSRREKVVGTEKGTEKEEGMGIGLYFVNETLRENFYGTIDCESQYGHWTRFTIRIPESVNYKED